MLQSVQVKMVTDYKLVDSVTQKALKKKYLETYGDNFLQSVTTHRGTPQTTNIPRNNNLTVSGPGNYSAATNSSRSPLWSLKYRGGYAETVATVTGANVAKYQIASMFLIISTFYFYNSTYQSIFSIYKLIFYYSF